MTIDEPRTSESDVAGVRVARLHQAASEIRGAIARAANPSEMLGVACRVALDVGGHGMARGGLIDTASADEA